MPHFISPLDPFLVFLPPNTNTTKVSKNPFFLKIKSPSAKAKELKMSWLSRQNYFRNFCFSDDTEKVYHKLEEVIYSIC